MENEKRVKYGSPIGLAITIAIGFALYFVLSALPNLKILPSYEEVIASINTPVGQIEWFLINFTEGCFYAGILATVFLLVGAAVAWRLSASKSKYAGWFELCYGQANIWPWVLGSQVLALFLTEYVFGYLHLFEMTGNAWIPTFIVTVTSPPAIVLMYGPGYKNMVTGAVLGAAITTPIAYWLSTVTVNLGLPGCINNIAAMTFSGVIICSICRVLPWMEHTEVKPTNNTNAGTVDYSHPSFILRRVFADITEPTFYGNEVVGVFLMAGACIEWLFNPMLSTGGLNAIPTIILCQFIASGLGAFLYAGKWQEKGWYATYIPGVSAAPACCFMHGATLPIIIFASVMGAIIAAPIQEWLMDHKKDYIHPFICNTITMIMSTVTISFMITIIPWL